MCLLCAAFFTPGPWPSGAWPPERPCQPMLSSGVPKPVLLHTCPLAFRSLPAPPQQDLLHQNHWVSCHRHPPSKESALAVGSQRPQGQSQCKDGNPSCLAGRSDPSSSGLMVPSKGTGGGDTATPFLCLWG